MRVPYLFPDIQNSHLDKELTDRVAVADLSAIGQILISRPNQHFELAEMSRVTDGTNKTIAFITGSLIEDDYTRLVSIDIERPGFVERSIAKAMHRDPRCRVTTQLY